MSCAAIPPILASIIARLAAAVPARARTTFLDLLLGAAVSKGGHVTEPSWQAASRVAGARTIGFSSRGVGHGCGSGPPCLRC
jgi:hypothetical protein